MNLSCNVLLKHGITIGAPCNGMSAALMLAVITMEEGCMPP